MKIIAFVGMPGSGKTLAAQFAKKKLGVEVLRLGDLTDEELKKRGLLQNEKNERIVREDLRKKYGMEIYAKKVSEKINALGKDVKVVILDGVRSFKEYQFLKNKYGENFVTISLLASEKTRHERLMSRGHRGLKKGEVLSRDKAELENLDHGSTIAMADYFILNEGIVKEKFREELDKILERILEKI